MEQHQRLRRQYGRCIANDRRWSEKRMRSCMLPGRPEIVVRDERDVGVPPPVTDVKEEAV